MRFILEHADRVTVDGLRWGVEPICTVLTEQGTPIAPSTYYGARSRVPSRRAARDARLKVEITRVHAASGGAYGARRVWLALRGEGVDVARCTVERLMRGLGVQGAHRGAEETDHDPGPLSVAGPAACSRGPAPHEVG